jgi:uncharacterized protein YacL
LSLLHSCRNGEKTDQFILFLKSDLEAQITEKESQKEDLLFGSLGLVFGLIIAYLIVNVIPLDNIPYRIFSTIIPVFLAFFLGYLGFQVGFKKKDELIRLQ